MNSLDLQDQMPRSSSEIQTEIQDTRKRMDSTLDEISNRLTPRSLMNTAMDWWDGKNAGAPGKEGIQKTYRVLSAQVKKNPAPSLLIGAGLAWLFFKSDEEDQAVPSAGNRLYPHLPSDRTVTDGEVNDSDEGPGLVQKIKEQAGGAKDTIVDLVEGAREKAGQVSEEAGELGHKAMEAYKTGKDTLHRQYDDGMERLRTAVDDYPLAVGAAFLALGALAGVVLPASRREDRLLGGKSDALLAEVKDKGQEMLDLGKQKAVEVGEDLVAKAEAHGITAENVGDKLAKVTAKTGEVARQAVEAAGAALKENTGTGQDAKQGDAR